MQRLQKLCKEARVLPVCLRSAPRKLQRVPGCGGDAGDDELPGIGGWVAGSLHSVGRAQKHLRGESSFLGRHTLGFQPYPMKM